MNRVLSAARLQVAHPLVIFGVPCMVVSISFAINWAIWALADQRNEPGAGFTGGVMALYITVGVVFVQAVTQLLLFAMGVSLSRRRYWLGVAVVGILTALGYGVELAALRAIGDATDGWGWACSSGRPRGCGRTTSSFSSSCSGIRREVP